MTYCGYTRKFWPRNHCRPNVSLLEQNTHHNHMQIHIYTQCHIQKDKSVPLSYILFWSKFLQLEYVVCMFRFSIFHQAFLTVCLHVFGAFGLHYYVMQDVI